MIATVHVYEPISFLFLPLPLPPWLSHPHSLSSLFAPLRLKQPLHPSIQTTKIQTIPSLLYNPLIFAIEPSGESGAAPSPQPCHRPQ